LDEEEEESEIRCYEWRDKDRENQALLRVEHEVAF